MLFGSQARGDFHKNSDFDVLVITKDPIPPKEKMDMESKISKSLVYTLHIPFDILLHSQGEANLKKQAKGFIIYHALKDTIEL
ncbi:nucleotidyltransferase domain-containing protein [Pedobacter sp. BS3]|nr:nucleotidyltransferase domain-containing protein [Pedobacter sp. BS3]